MFFLFFFFSVYRNSRPLSWPTSVVISSVTGSLGLEIDLGSLWVARNRSSSSGSSSYSLGSTRAGGVLRLASPRTILAKKRVLPRAINLAILSSASRNRFEDNSRLVYY